MVHALVAVAVYKHRLARPQQRHQHRLVRRGRSVRHVPARRGAEYLARELLGLRERRVRLGAREVSEGLDGHREVRAEYRVAERLVEAAQERRVRESASSVVSRRVPVRARLKRHVLLERRREARHPEALEEVHDALVVARGLFEHHGGLLRPASRRKRHRWMPRPREHDLRYRGEKQLEPRPEREALDLHLHQVVVDQEQTAGASELGEDAPRASAREEPLRECRRVVDGDELHRRIVQRSPRVERLAAEVAEGVGKPVLDDRQPLRVEAAGLVQVENGQCPYHK